MTTFIKVKLKNSEKRTNEHKKIKWQSSRNEEKNYVDLQLNCLMFRMLNYNFCLKNRESENGFPLKRMILA